MAISASYFPVAASFFAASGNSNAPGTCTTSTSLLVAPARSSTSTAAARSRSVIKLLNRLTIIPKRRPTALNAPLIFPGCNFSAIAGLCCSFPHPLLPFELRHPLLQKRFGSLAHIFGRASYAKQRRLQEQSFFLRHFHSTLDRFHGEFHRKRPVRDDFLRDRFCGGNQLRRLMDVIDQPDALCFFRRNHFAGQAQFVRHAFAAQSRQALRSAVSRQNPQLYFRLPELRGLACDSDGARKRQLAPAAQRKSIDRADRRLPHRLQQMKNTLPEKRKFLAIDRCLQGQFADVRASHERLFSCAREDQRAHRRVIASVEQRMPQFFDGLAVQRIQHLRPVEGDVGNPVFLLVQNVLVAHFFPLLGLALLSVSSASSLSSVPLC